MFVAVSKLYLKWKQMLVEFLKFKYNTLVINIYT